MSYFNKQENKQNDAWQQQTINKLLFAGIQEQRRARRWGIFFKLLFVSYLFVTTYIIMVDKKQLFGQISNKPYTAVVKLEGIINTKAVNAADIVNALEKAFKSPMSKGVILSINSPGGSPVQSRQIYSAMRNLQAQYKGEKKLYAVIKDSGASGAYLVACGADMIYADQTSIIGSIGVVMGSFGFVDGMKKLGIERRLYTAGGNKGMLDPFSPVIAEQEQFIKQSLDAIHQVFINDVKQGRGERLHLSEDIFSGRIWVGVEAIKLGLIDGFGDEDYLAREIIKAPNLVEYKVMHSILDKFKMYAHLFNDLLKK